MTQLLIPVQEAHAESAVDPRFGRARHFLLFNTETGESRVHENTQNLNAAQGAGIQAAQAAVDLGADWVLAGHCGPKAFAVLNAAGIQVATGIDGLVSDVIQRWRDGRITASSSANVEGHW